MTLAINGTSGLLQNYDYQTPTTGFTYTFNAYNALVMNPAGTLATGTITMPAAPVDGMTITFSSTKIITTLTVSANTGQTINNAVTTLAAGQSASYVYRAASTAWFPFSNVSASTTATPYGGPRARYYSTPATGQRFTIPTGVTSAKITIVGGGGGGGSGGGCPGANGGSGGAGASLVQWVTGLTPGNTLTVAVGARGTGGTSSNNGGGGGTSSVASGTQTITTLQCTGGTGGIGGNGGGGSGSSGTATGTSSGIAITGVVITGPVGTFSCTASSFPLAVGQQILISGTSGGTGSITGYSNPTLYYIIVTDGSTTFTLSTTYGGGAVGTAAGTPTGLTYTINDTDGRAGYAFAAYGLNILNGGSGGGGSSSSGGGPGSAGGQGYVLIEY